jgi:hypothetical protein
MSFEVEEVELAPYISIEDKPSSTSASLVVSPSLRTPWERQQLLLLADWMRNFTDQRLTFFNAPNTSEVLRPSQKFAIQYPTSTGGLSVDYPDFCFTDHGASFDLIDIMTARRLNLPILPSPLRLQNSTSTNGNVLGITPLVSFCYGCEFLETPTGIISAPRPMLVTEGLHKLYSVLISNTDTLRFRGRVDYDTNTYTLNHPDGQVITLPITQRSI